jgi:hypothetical protein
VKLVSLPHAALGFDCFELPTADQYLAMRALGFVFHAGYLDNTTPENLTDCLAAGLYWVPVQTARGGGWTPSSETGGEDGARARRDGIRLGLPEGINLFRDFEGCNVLTTNAEMEADSISWCTEMRPSGFVGKVYLGNGLPVGVTPEFLYRKLAYKGYWSSFSLVPDVAVRSYQMRQLYRHPRGECLVSDVFPEAPAIVADMPIDADVALSDYLGGRVNAVSG